MLNLDKVVYDRITDGAYTLTPTKWELKATPNSEEYVALFCKLDNTPRIIQVNLFEKGLDIAASNIKAHFNLEAMTLADLLNWSINQELPATHETVTVDDKTYYNWHICRTERDIATLEDSDEEF